MSTLEDTDILLDSILDEEISCDTEDCEEVATHRAFTPHCSYFICDNCTKISWENLTLCKKHPRYFLLCHHGEKIDPRRVRITEL